jgi:hypothetical protein
MKGFNKYNLPPWLRNFRDVLKQFIVPISVFQGIRTFLIPTTADLLFLIILVLIAIAFQNDVI